MLRPRIVFTVPSGFEAIGLKLYIPFIVPNGWEVAYEGQTYGAGETVLIPDNDKKAYMTVTSVGRENQ